MPFAFPVTIPDIASTEAIEGLLLLHVPVAGIEFNVVVSPRQTFKGPVIVPGNGFTVIICVAAQPVGIV